MADTNWLVRIVIGIVALIIIYIALYIYSLSQISMQTILVDGVHAVNSTSSTFDGQLVLKNDGPLDVRLQNVEYELILAGTNQRLVSGVISGDVLPAGETKSYPLTMQLQWNSLADVVKLLAAKNTNATLRGVVHVDVFGVTEIPVPFEQKIDLTPFLSQMVASQQFQDKLQNGLDYVRSGLQAVFG